MCTNGKNHYFISLLPRPAANIPDICPITALEMASTCVTEASPSGGGGRLGTPGAPDLDTICTELTGYGTALCTDRTLPAPPTHTISGMRGPPVAGATIVPCRADWPDRTGTILSTSQASSLEFTTVSGLTTIRRSVLT